MSLLPKIKTIFSIVVVLDKMKYKFKNRAVLEVPDKLVIVVTNLLICYQIVKVSYVRLLLITKLMFISIEFEVFGKTSWIYDGLAKPGREIRAS